MRRLFKLTTIYISLAKGREERPVAPGATCTITTMPNQRCNVLRLLILEEHFKSFNIGNIWLGVDSINLHEDHPTDSIMLHNRIKLYGKLYVGFNVSHCSLSPILEIGQAMSIEVTNRSDEPSPFECEVWGYFLSKEEGMQFSFPEDGKE
jgi:hypothetical protein